MTSILEVCQRLRLNNLNWLHIIIILVISVDILHVSLEQDLIFSGVYSPIYWYMVLVYWSETQIAVRYRFIIYNVQISS